MPDVLYTRLLNTANRLIDKYGKPAIVRRNTNSGDPWNPDRSPTDYNVIYVETGDMISDRSNTLIRQDDVLGIVSMSGEIAVLEKSDILIVEGRELEFIELKPLNPGGLQLLTEFQAR